MFLRSFNVMANTSDDFHGSDILTIIGYDNTMLYSQPLVIEVHTMVSPCVHGHCVGGVADPECRSTDRVESFAGKNNLLTTCFKSDETVLKLYR